MGVVIVDDFEAALNDMKSNIYDDHQDDYDLDVPFPCYYYSCMY